MKFCKDCTHYAPAIATMFFGIPAICNYGDKRDPVTGDTRIAGTCDELRNLGSQCGPHALWFKLKEVG